MRYWRGDLPLRQPFRRGDTGLFLEHLVEVVGSLEADNDGRGDSAASDTLRQSHIARGSRLRRLVAINTLASAGKTTA